LCLAQRALDVTPGKNVATKRHDKRLHALNAVKLVAWHGWRL
jgi:hypothetical protein